MSKGMLAINIIGEFLEHFKLDFTLSVYKKELRANDFNRDDIIDNLNLKHVPHHGTPILLHILQDYIKGLEQGYMGQSGISQQHNNYMSFENEKKQTFADGFYKPSQEISQNSKEENYSISNALNKGKAKEEEEEKKRKIQAWQEEQERIEREEEEKREAERKERERREEIERLYQEKVEQEKREEEEKEQKKKEKQEQRKKEKEKAKKEKKLPPTAVNTIRGGANQDENALANIYGLGITGQPQQYDEYDPYGDPYGEDPYAYDITQAQNQDEYGDYGTQNAYDYDISGPAQNKFSSAAYNGDPYANIDLDGEIDQNQAMEAEDNYYMDEEIDQFAESANSPYNYKDKDRKNPMFTSSEDFYGASQSQGFDQSVNSDAIEMYDHYEQIKKKR